ncbi:transposase [mine drainage metagenome]|uniref:Transposase n=2 Tax=mine drainage metagenome TaxID=410659 RepID=T1A177_9ZZZZ
MAIKRHKRGGRVYRAEYHSVREGTKVRSVFVRYLGVEGKPLRPTAGKTLARLSHGASRRAGAVRLLWKFAEDLKFRETIDRICSEDLPPDTPSAGTCLTLWAINRVLDPDSATQLGPWVGTTDLPLLAGFPDEAFTKDAFLFALDPVCHDEPALAQVVDHTRELDRALSALWREQHPLPKGEKEVLAYDLSNVLFFGVTCPIAEVGRNPDHQARPQVNVAVVVSRHDRVPLLHFVYSGRRNGAGTTRNLLVELQKAEVPPGLLIVDRGLMNARMAEEARGMGWHLLGGVSRHSKEVPTILEGTKVAERPETFAAKTRLGGLYAVKVRTPLWKMEREVVVYANAAKAQREREERNEALARITKALTELGERGTAWDEAKLHETIRGTVGEWSPFLEVRVRRKGAGPRVVWRLKQQALRAVERQDGKYLLLCTDGRLSAEEVVTQYLGKDFVEKCFRTLKTDVELEPVRHRRERRVRAYLFVCMLALRLQMALRAALREGGVKDDDVAEYQEQLLEDLGRVERVEVRLGHEAKTWYLNVTDRVTEGLRRLGRKDLLKEDIRVADTT